MPNKQELTPKQREVLEAVGDWVREHGRPPTLREMAQRMGVSSTNAIRDHLRVLDRSRPLAVESAGLTRSSHGSPAAWAFHKDPRRG